MHSFNKPSILLSKLAHAFGEFSVQSRPALSKAAIGRNLENIRSF
jgi:hypothetical protein